MLLIQRAASDCVRIIFLRMCEKVNNYLFCISGLRSKMRCNIYTVQRMPERRTCTIMMMHTAMKPM